MHCASPATDPCKCHLLSACKFTRALFYCPEPTRGLIEQAPRATLMGKYVLLPPWGSSMALEWHFECTREVRLLLCQIVLCKFPGSLSASRPPSPHGHTAPCQNWIRPCIPHPIDSALLALTPPTLNPTPYTLNPKPKTLNPKPSTLTLNPKPNITSREKPMARAIAAASLSRHARRAVQAHLQIAQTFGEVVPCPFRLCRRVSGHA